MPISNYGVWKAKPVSYTYETKEDDPVDPHIYLIFSDGETKEAEAAINIKSGNCSESRLVYWVVPALNHPIVSELEALKEGFHSLEDGSGKQSGNLRLDYIRENLFQQQTGRLLPHDIPGKDNDILDVLKPILDEAKSCGANIYLYGARYSNKKGSHNVHNSRHNSRHKEGIHNIHMNQGNSKPHEKDNGVYHDGGFFLQFEDHWKAIFLGFASQAVHTKDHPPKDGYPDPQSDYLTWADFLDPKVPAEERAINDVTDTPVLIRQALVGPDNLNKPTTVFLTNRTEQPLDLTGWKIRTQAGQFEGPLPSGATLRAKEVSKEFKVPKCSFSDQGELITLLNAQGLKVHGVSYAKVQSRPEGSVISFEQINRLNTPYM